MNNTIFVSYKFDDSRAANFRGLIGNAVQKLKRLSIVDGKTLIAPAGFATNIAEFIKDQSDCLVAVLTAGRHYNRNVLFEVGVAVGASKKLIIVADSKKRVPSMLQHHDIIIVPDALVPTWPKDLQEDLEKRLRFFFQLPDDHFLENKLRRRYSAEERQYLKNAAAVELPIAIIRSGDLWKAISVLERQLSRDPSNLDSIFLLSEAHYLQGCSEKTPTEREAHFREQLHLAERGLALEPKHVLLVHARATAFMRLGKFAQASQELNHLLSLDEGFSIGQYNASCLAALDDDKELMLAHLTKAVSTNPDWKDFAKEDPDFMAFSQDAEWQDLVYSTST